MKRIVVHWTAGSLQARALDRAHCHVLVEENGKLIRGAHAMSQNQVPGGGAQHTCAFNTPSIGVAACCMWNAVQSPFNAGPHPLTERQYDTLAR